MEHTSETRDVAIRLSGVKKMYKLGQIGGGTLTADLQSWWARIRGKEDPNTKIGTDQRLIGKTFMALNGIDLTVYKGEALGIIGGNGAGKSTMLKLLSRVTAPTEGEIDLYGRIASMLEVGTGFNGEMTGRENVYMNGAILGMTKAEIDAKMEDIIEFSEVREFIDTPVKRYSSGMYVKLAFSVAAHLDSEIMIMDEVLAVGDMAFQKKCLDKMRDAAKKEGRTVLYVSHNMNTIRQLCDRCVVLDQGKVVFEGDVESAIDVYMQTKMEAGGVEFDFTSTKVRPAYISSAINVTHLKLLHKDIPVYTKSEQLQFSLQIKATKDCANLNLRLELRFGDDSPIGTIPMLPLGVINADGEKQVVVNFDPRMLTVGRYRMCLVLFEIDEFHNSHDLDLLLPAFQFEIQDEDGIVWNHRSWGHINLMCAEVMDK